MPEQYNRENNGLNVEVFIQLCQPFNCSELQALMTRLLKRLLWCRQIPY